MNTRILIVFLHVVIANMMLQAQTNPVGAIPGVIDVSPMGAATYTIPIEVVPGTQGMQPNLSIVYNSFGGMGLLGMKWNLSGLSSITRCGQIPYFDENITAIQFSDDDRLSLDGDRLLLLSKGDYWTVDGEYATEMENFTKIVSFRGANGIDYFRAYTDDGTIIEYGNTAGNPSNSKQEVATGKILSWCINKITDINGNYMTFEYDKNGNEIFIKRIKYTGNNNPNLMMETYARVEFNYKSLPDTMGRNTYFVGGYGIPQTKLLEFITVTYKDTVVREYEFKYNTRDTGERTTHLKEIVLHGSGINPPKLHATTIDWGENNETDSLIVSMPNVPKGLIVTGDFNGDGFTDYVIYGQGANKDTWKLYTGSETGSFTPTNIGGKHQGIDIMEDGPWCIFYRSAVSGDGYDNLI